MIKDFRRRYRVSPGKKARLHDRDPDDMGGFKDKEQGAKRMAMNTARLQSLQLRLYAENRRSILIVLQGPDASGKDGTIRAVMSGLSPQGTQVTSFKKPSSEELDHDFLWRIHKALPERGGFGIFNRSHYEDVLIVRVHELVPRSVWSKRYDQINDFERILVENGTTILKFYLFIDKNEQRKRLQERLEDPTKKWKFLPGDIEERKLWDDYMDAYEDALTRCSTPWAPWYVIPANRNWFRNLVISSILVETLEEMDPRFPRPKIDVSKIRLD